MAALSIADVSANVTVGVHGFAGPGGVSPATVDRDGNRNLIEAATEAGAEHFVLLSVKGASPDHPMDLMRMKFAAEQELKSSGLEWTIIRPTAYIETWCDVLGTPLLKKGKTLVFGRGQNPINWVSAGDVARFVEVAVVDPALRGMEIDVGGAENLSMTDFVDVFQRATGCFGSVRHVSPIAMRLAAIAMSLARSSRARQIRAGIVMDTAPMAFDAFELTRSYPAIRRTSVAEVARQEFRPSK
jgi:uncharacterized protein YbjT (DUF2867 family)